MNPRREYFDSMAQQWDSLPAPPDAAARVVRFVTAALRPSDRFICDVGAGSGILLQALPRVRIVEFDISEAMLAESRRKWEGRSIEAVCADALRPPFRDSFDCVLCFGVLPHLGDPRDALAALLECARPGGAIAVGHLMASDELNAFHAALDGPVNRDHLIPAPGLAAVLEDLGARPSAVEEEPGWYFVRAEK